MGSTVKKLLTNKDQDIDADSLIEASIALVRSLKQSKPPVDFKTRRLSMEISKPQHLEEMFESGHKSNTIKSKI